MKYEIKKHRLPKYRNMEGLYKYVLRRLGPITGAQLFLCDLFEMVCTYYDMAEEDYDMKYRIDRSYWIKEYTTGLTYQALGRMLGMHSGVCDGKMDYEMLIKEGKEIINSITEHE